MRTIDEIKEAMERKIDAVEGRLGKYASIGDKPDISYCKGWITALEWVTMDQFTYNEEEGKLNDRTDRKFDKLDSEKKLTYKEWNKLDELLSQLGFGGYYDMREQLLTIARKYHSDELENKLRENKEPIENIINVLAMLSKDDD